MKKQILAEEVDQIIQQSFWGKGGVKLTESVEGTQGQEQVQEPVQADEEQIEEAVEAHVCPLCESQLEEAISDEQLAEHVDFMVSVISEMEDITDEDLDELAEEITSDESEEEDLDEAKKKPSFLKNIMKSKQG
jgi:DNA repair exonuclease SbcCD ATPase subunit